MKRILKRITPLQAGKLLGILYGALGLIFAPIILIVTLVTANAPGGLPVVVGVGLAIAAPIFYGIMGFLVGLIGAAIYNLVAQWVGGLEVEVE